MSRLKSLVLLSLSLNPIACGGVEFPSAKVPTPDEAAAVVPPPVGFGTDEIVKSEDRSYLAGPHLALGELYGLLKTTDGSCKFAPERLQAITPGLDREKLSFTDPTPELATKSLLVNDKLAAKVDALGFLKASVDSDHVVSANLTMTAQRLKDDAGFKDAIKQQKIPEEACALFVVMGFVHETYTYKTFKKIDSKVGGGAYGVNADGQYYSSNETFERHDAFLLSIRKVTIPGSVERVDALEKGLSEATKPSADELRGLQEFWPRRPKSPRGTP